VQEGASDIHISPEDARLRIRFRTDGMLHDVPAPPKSYHQGIVARVKVLRVLASRPILRELAELGLAEHDAENFRRLIRRPHGIILVTGPTGSGKTVSLYAALRAINSKEKHIITVEDPVEFWLDSVRQIQVNPRAGLTFASGLRAILRHDPDVIMVGEIRDLETAQTAVHASLTGHLVFATLHTNDAPGAVTRLVDMGIEPFLVSASLAGVLAQRLLRAVCHRCKEPYDPPTALLKEAGLLDRKEEVTFYRGRGCPACNQTGYRGRTGIFELMTVTDDIREAVLNKASAKELYELARKHNLRTLREDGIEKVLKGISTLEEVIRVTQLD